VEAAYDCDGDARIAESLVGSVSVEGAGGRWGVSWKGGVRLRLSSASRLGLFDANCSGRLGAMW
jgi:hypothetical protein